MILLFQKLLFEMWIIFNEMAPYLLLGFTFAGIFHVLFKKEFVAHHLGGSSFSSVIKAAFLGVPLPLCSCGVVPTALSLRKNSASEGATVSFLISTPQTGVDSIIATYGMLGPVFALFRPIVAFIMGIAGGVVTNILVSQNDGVKHKQKQIFSCNLCGLQNQHTHTIIEKINGMIRYGYGSFLDDIVKQLIIGIILSGIISYIIPPNFFSLHIGNTVLEMVLMIVGGIPFYVCATSSIPIAVVLMMKGISPGAAFVFLAVGPATNAATITLIANAMGKKVVAIYLGTITIMSLIAGIFLNIIMDYTGKNGINMQNSITHENHLPTQISLFTLFFMILISFSLFRVFFPNLWMQITHQKKYSNNHNKIKAEQCYTVMISGMSCRNCADHISNAIYTVEGVISVNIDLHARNVNISGIFDKKDIIKKIREAGYSCDK